MDIKSDTRLLEELYEVVGARFRRQELIFEALTHSSLAKDLSLSGVNGNNERLEFLGDAVLQLVLSHLLYQKFPQVSEGELTKMRAILVSRKTLSRLAKDLGLGRFLILGKSEVKSGGRSRASTLGNALEAIIGALYLDGGITAAEVFIAKILHADIQKVQDCLIEDNPKGILQELIQSTQTQTPIYEILSESGQAHEKTFESVVSWGGIHRGQGSGKSKKQAEMAAAANALERLNKDLSKISQQ